MSDSITNPQGLQDSLVNMSKQFAYFDNQTKTFKISVEGVLRLKELQEQTGISANEMMKLGLAAKEADARISAISSVGLNVKEEDKQLLSNISRMGDGGEYEISVKDSQTGERRWEKLTSISQDQLEATLKEQKERPKTLEDIARSQLDYSQMVAGDVQSIYHGLKYGFASKQSESVEGLSRLTNAITGTLSDYFGKTSGGKKMADLASADIKQFLKDFNDPKKGLGEASAMFLETVEKQSQTLGADFKEGTIKAFNMISDKLTNGKTSVERSGKDVIDKLLGSYRKPNTEKGNFPIQNALMGKSDPIDLGSRKFSTNTPGDALPTSTTTKTTVDVGGKIQVEFNTSNGSELTRKMLDDWANSPQTKQYFMNLTAQQDPTKAPITTTYGN
jgi:hypothetical protein